MFITFNKIFFLHNNLKNNISSKKISTQSTGVIIVISIFKYFKKDIYIIIMVENGNGYRIMPPELEELYCCRHNKNSTIARFALKYINIGYSSSLYWLDMNR